MIDTHAHLAERFSQTADLAELKAVILSASTEKDSLDNLELARTNPKLFPSVGIHPGEVKEDIDGQIAFLEELLREKSTPNPSFDKEGRSNGIVAIGECGLELMEDHVLNSQETLFRGQITLAIKYKKPLIIHSREASEEVLRILSDYSGLRGVIHCYTGGKKRIKKFLELQGEWYFGIDGNLTYEPGLEQVVKEIPKERLVLETDTPFLSPIPHRGETNQPAYVKFIYEKVADIWGMSFKETEKIVDENSERLFGMKILG